MAAQRPRQRHLGEKPRQDFLIALADRIGVIGCVKHLKAQTVFLQRQINDLPQIARINIAKDIAPPHRRIDKIAREVLLIFMRLDHIADPQRVDINARAPLKRARGVFIDLFDMP